MADQSSSKSSKCSFKPRIIGRIRGFTDLESNSVTRDTKPWITVKNPQGNGSSEKSTVFFEAQFTSRKDTYELDYCYQQDDEIRMIYSREVKPLISEAFNGRNVSIVALGAKGSGKTYTIQGSQEKSGLAVMAMSEILSIAGELGRSVYVSLYELAQDHAYDLLDPKHPKIQVMEDAHGKINLKGLSQVPVNSISEFQTIYFSTISYHKAKKLPMDPPRNHRGLMVHISADDKQKSKLANKINFVDLAGYEDPRTSSRDGIKLTEINRNNKSLYALLNVISALKANEIRLPYRESKFTRILQESLVATSHMLLIACLNPSFCQDTISSISLVSRSYRSTKQILTDSTNRNRSTIKVKDQSSLKSGRTMSASLSVKKNFGNSHLLAEKKATSILKGRKLFGEGKRTSSKQLKCQSEDMLAQKSRFLPDLASVISPFSLEKAVPVEPLSVATSPIRPIEYITIEELESQSESHNTSSPRAADGKAIILAEKDVSSHVSPNLNLDAKALTHYEAASTYEESSSFHKKVASPPLSEKIREISNNLKSLVASTPLRITMPEEVVAPCSNQAGHKDTLEPKTPIMELGSARHHSPCSTFGNMSSVKHSLVQEYLKFFNSASKEELKGLRGIGEKRAAYILELREESPDPFKNLDDLQDIGLSAKQIKGLMKHAAGELFDQIS